MIEVLDRITLLFFGLAWLTWMRVIVLRLEAIKSAISSTKERPASHDGNLQPRG